MSGMALYLFCHCDNSAGELLQQQADNVILSYHGHVLGNGFANKMKREQRENQYLPNTNGMVANVRRHSNLSGAREEKKKR